MNASISAPILLIGATGQIGWELARDPVLHPLIEAPSRDSLDLTSPDQIRACVRELKPKLIINAAAYTAVDRAENEPQLAAAINSDAPAFLAEEAKRLGIGLVHFSTDYVFDGEPPELSAALRPYRENDAVNPINVYGRTKLAGERAISEIAPAHLMLRTSWIFATRGRNFFLTIQRLSRERETLRIVDDQIGSPTWAGCVATATSRILSQFRNADAEGEMKDVSGVYHLTAGGQTSWHGFASAIVNQLQANAGAETVTNRVAPIPSSEFPTSARRPPYSVLDCSLIREVFGIALPSWEDQLSMCLENRHSFQA
jgi:dTDP-4-dehydrorhamnose reductase